MPAPSAAFSPLTTQKSTSSSSFRPGSRSSSARRPGGPKTSATTGFSGDRQRRCGIHGDRHAVPDICREARERLLFEFGQVGDCSDPGRRGGERVPTLSAGSGRSCAIETTAEGSVSGWISICAPTLRPLITNGVRPTTFPSTGEYTSVPAAAPTSTPCCSGSPHPASSSAGRGRSPRRRCGGRCG